MSGPKISIIIPVYNVEQYLQECIDSCVNQTLKEIEIICVDDCSTDSSLDILTRYAKEDSRVRVLGHQNNRKQGAARNTGLKYASGEYIWFVDSDDILALNACQLLYDTATELGVDVLSFCGNSFVEESGKKKFLSSFFFQGLPFNRVLFPVNEWRKIRFYSLCAVPWVYIVKKSVIGNLRFREGVFHEDTDFSLILFSTVSSFCCIPYTAYNHRLGTGSETQGAMTKKRLEDSISVITSLNDFVVSQKVSPKHFLHKFMVEYVDQTKLLCETHNSFKPRNIEDVNKFHKKYSPWKTTVMFRKMKGVVKNMVLRCLLLK